ncbi:MAG TPA: CHASE domain-containing protein [Burkholderiales bacterium]|jgi:signal transduction histidine kinase/ActR/RegA family two-component response regulator
METRPWFRSWALLGTLVPLAVLAATLAITHELWRQEWRNIERETRTNFAFRTQEAIARIEQRLHSYEQVLHATDGLFQAAGRVGPDEFHDFVGNLQLGANYPGVLEVGYCRFEPAAGAGRPRCPVAYIESVAGSGTRALSYDNFADVVRREAMEEARDSGKVAISNKVRLLGEDAVAAQTGVRMYLPVYRKGAVIIDAPSRRASLAGYVYATFDLDRLTESLIGPRGAEVAVEVVDDTVTEGGELFDSDNDRVGGESAVRLLYDAKSIDIGGYTWTITVRSLPDLVSPLVTGRAQLIANAGIAAAFLLSFFTWFFMRGRSRALLAAQKLIERDAMLTAASARAEAANASKSRFLAAVSHDLRQPLQSLLLLSSVLKRRIDDPASVAVVKPMEASIFALKELLDSLLDLSKLDAGAVTPNPHAVLLADLLERLEHEFRIQVEVKGLRFRVHHPRMQAGAALLTDPALLMAVLRNLLSNAASHTRSGGVLIGCRLRGDHALVQVWDTGIGIPASELDHIFEEYYQLNNPGRDRALGLGLGLAIVERITRLLGHPVRVRSRVGHGSVFEVTVPLTAAPAAPPAQRPAAATMAAAIVVLDDDATVLRSTGLFLRQLGHEPLLAGNLQAALAIVRDRALLPQAIIADYRLGDGGETGIDAVQAIRAELRSTIPAILVTGNTQPTLLQEARAAGCELLHKPVDPEQLDNLLWNLLDQRSGVTD